MIFIPKYTDLYNKEPISVHQGHSGEIRLILREVDETVVYDSGWFDNLITNNGLVNMGDDASWSFRCNLGSDATAPAFTDSSLYAWMDDATMTDPVLSLAPVAPDYEYSITKVCRFQVGEATGTIREIGFNSHVASSNTDMSIRALVSPPVVKAANQVLDVYYKVTVWPDTVDRTGTVTIDSISYDYIVRGANFTDTAGINPLNSWTIRGLYLVASSHYVTDQEIEAIDSKPPSVSNQYYGDTITEVGNGSGYHDQRVFWDLDSGNWAGGIRSFFLRSSESQSQTRGWQIRVGKTTGDGTLFKDNTMVLDLDFRVTWSRH